MKSYFRPYTKAATTSGCNTEAGHITTHPSKPCSFVGNTGDDDWHLLAGTKEDCSQTLLFVHQEEWQRDLMVKYGNTISLMDATYKTTQYDLPLFFVCVKTNTGYITVAEFVVQSENGNEIGEALAKLQEWNPSWNPRFFVIDYSEAELIAIESAFPNCQTYLVASEQSEPDGPADPADPAAASASQVFC